MPSLDALSSTIGVLGALVPLVLGTTAGAQSGAKPAVELRPAEASMVGDPITARVTGLPADRKVVLFSELVDRYGRLWIGEAEFRSSAAGIVDPGQQAPTDGAWNGADAKGPFWALRRKTKRGAHPQPGGGDAERVAISALIDGRPVATAATLRWFRRPEVEEIAIDAEGLVARFLAPRAKDRRPAIVVVPGSGGGIPVHTAEQLASRGYAALALAYFGEPGLPQDLELVPLEYVDRAIDWLKRQSRVDPRRLAIMGGSKGGELALLVASRRPDLRAVVAAVPSSVVFQCIADGWPRTSSWSIAAEGLSFVPYVASKRDPETGRLSFLYEDSLNNTSAVAAATIPVENIGGPILLISGRDDWMWPATAMCEQIEKRLAAREFAHQVVHLAYDDVGHEVATAGFRPVSWSPRVGGTRQGHAAAQADAWGKLVAFLERNL